MSRWLLLLGLLTVGCAITQHCHRPAEISAPCLAPDVHIVIIHGLDPLDVGNLRGLRNNIASWGYAYPTLVQFYEGGKAVREIIRLKEANPQAHILLFGFSAGASTSSWVINRLHHHHGIDVDTVVYSAGITLLDVEYNRPSFVGKIIHIRDGGRLIPGMNLTGAENYRFRDVWHFGSPMHPNTLAILQNELATLRGSKPD
jgi:hypothetical protein